MARATPARKSPVTCNQVSAWLSEYLDGDLAPGIARSIAEHLSRCVACRRLAGELALTITALHHLAPDRAVTLGWLGGHAGRGS